jgi:O-antigen/teichoic acid export membrane protein
MQAQNMMWVPALATCFAAVVNIPVNLLLIKYYQFEGAAAAFSVTRILLFLFLVCKSLGALSSFLPTVP